MKGAPEVVLPLCTRMLDSTGSVVELSDDLRDVILQKRIIEEFASSYGYRTFVYAYKDINSDDWEKLQ